MDLGNPELPNILVIDDDVISLTTISSYLRDSYNVQMTHDPNRGFTTAVNDHPDVILLDIEMPKLGGMEMLENLKRLQMSRSIPVILLSAHDTNELRDRAKDLNAFAYLTKPCSLTELKKVINQALSETE